MDINDTGQAWTVAPVTVGTSRLTRLWSAFRGLRLEEALFVAAFIPSTLATFYAHWSLAQEGAFSGKISGGIPRLTIATLLALTIPLIERSRAALGVRPRLAAVVDIYRTMLPFLLCVAVYTNLHDTVRFINPHDVHASLVAIEGWLFGGQPVVWAERFITPARTELFSAFYTSFFLIAPSLVIVLLATGHRVEARRALLGTIICFYTGYVLYLIFPAAPPRLYLASLGYFSGELRGGSMGITAFQNALIAMMPNEAPRAAFPSLHAAVSLLTVYYAWRYCRWYAPVVAVVTTGLLIATIYLRHHYVVDLIAGALLVPWVLWITPKCERWWSNTSL